jgi:glycosyltransferase involved in cell wall biosynthesis
MILVEVFLFGSSFHKLLNLGNGIREIEYYDELSKELDECLIIDYKSSKYFNSEFKVYSKPCKMSNILWSLIAAFNVAKELKLKRGEIIVRSKQNLGAWTAYLTAKLLSSKYILRMGYSYAQSKRYESVFGLILYPILYTYEFVMIRLSDQVIISSEYLGRKFFVKNYSLIRNSIDLRFVRARSATKEYRWISVGRIIKMKGSDKLSLFANSRDDGVIIGDNPENFSLGKNNYFHRIDNLQIAKYFGKSKYYVSFSNTEGNPKTLMEAVFSGCIPVLNNIPAHTDVINELGYGYIINNITEACKIIDDDKSNFSESKYIEFINRWSTENVVRKELELLYQCVE